MILDWLLDQKRDITRVTGEFGRFAKQVTRQHQCNFVDFIIVLWLQKLLTFG